VPASLCTDHGCALGDAPQRFRRDWRAPQTNGTLNALLVNVMSFVRRREHFGFVDVIDAELLQICASAKCPMRHLAITGIDTVAIISRIFLGEAIRRNPALRADLRRNALQRHNRDRSSLFGNSSLLSIGHVHDYPPLSISARPVFRRREVELPLCWDIGVSLRNRYRSRRGASALLNIDLLYILSTSRPVCDAIMPSDLEKPYVVWLTPAAVRRRAPRALPVDWLGKMLKSDRERFICWNMRTTLACEGVSAATSRPSDFDHFRQRR